MDPFLTTDREPAISRPQRQQVSTYYDFVEHPEAAVASDHLFRLLDKLKGIYDDDWKVIPGVSSIRPNDPTSVTLHQERQGESQSSY